LLNEAPAELRARFTADSASSSVASLTFEFSSAAILRPWFVSEAFRARFWRFADASRILSDGGTPPKGVYPAYVTAIIFARRVTVEEKRAEPGPAANPFDGFRFTVAVKDPERLTRISPEALIAAQPRRVSVTSPTMNIRMAEAVSPTTATMRVAKPQVTRAADMSAAVARPVAAQAVAARPIRLSTVAVTRLPQPSAPSTAPTAPVPSPPSSPLATPDDSIYILAFICKAVPKSPDPDLTLQW
jgi:hypothetical protein